MQMLQYRMGLVGIQDFPVEQTVRNDIVRVPEHSPGFGHGIASSKGCIVPAAIKLRSLTTKQAGRFLNSQKYLLISGAAAIVPRTDIFSDYLTAGIGVRIKQTFDCHNHPGCTESALNGPGIDEGFLNGMKRPVGTSKSLDGLDEGINEFFALQFNRTGFYRPSVYQDRTCTALPLTTSVPGA